MAIDIVNRQRLVAVDHADLARVAGGVLLEIGTSRGIYSSTGVAIAIVRSKQMRRLNRLYRGKDIDTDVLSFPVDREDNARGNFHLGDVVICADVALRQSVESGLSIDREIAELVIHGVLHLAGYDHEADNGEMNRLELKLRRRLLDRQIPPAAPIGTRSSIPTVK